MSHSSIHTLVAEATAHSAISRFNELCIYESSVSVLLVYRWLVIEPLSFRFVHIAAEPGKYESNFWWTPNMNSTTHKIEHSKEWLWWCQTGIKELTCHGLPSLHKSCSSQLQSYPNLSLYSLQSMISTWPTSSSSPPTWLTSEGSPDIV